jgi:hypothetical protein
VKRRLFNAATLVSLVVGLVIVAAWIRSFWWVTLRDAYWSVPLETGEHAGSFSTAGFSLVSHGGAIHLTWFENPLIEENEPRGASKHIDWADRRMTQAPDFLSGWMLRYQHGMGMGRAAIGDVLTVPYWIVATPWLVVPLLWAWCHRPRRGPQACPACGYDLRGTPGGAACPECGKSPVDERADAEPRAVWGVAGAMGQSSDPCGGTRKAETTHG